MSPEKPTPQHDDNHEQDTIELSDGRSVPKAAVDALRVLDEKWPGATLRIARPAIVAAVLEALHVDGYDVAKRSDLGVTKGLAGMAEVVAKHQLLYDEYADRWGSAFQCKCGWQPDEETAPDNDQDAVDAAHGQHVADELTAALDLIGRRTDIVAIQLPEPDEGVWYINDGGCNVHLGPPGGVLVDAGAMLWGINTDEARTLAAALLAAAARADAAEGEAK